MYKPNSSNLRNPTQCQVRKFARETDCHVWFVAHPRQQHAARTGGKGGGGAGGSSPGLYDISGSAHWFNKTDNGIVVHRRFEVRADPLSGKEVRMALPEVEIKLQKVRERGRRAGGREAVIGG